jgi:hypothetical protein
MITMNPRTYLIEQIENGFVVELTVDAGKKKFYFSALDAVRDYFDEEIKEIEKTLDRY